jgi:hypothetical protein
MGRSTFSLLAVLVLFSSALSSPAVPSAVVPNFSDLKIKTRHSGTSSSFIETVYLKGARQRHEYVYDKPFNLRPASITRCDDRKRIDLNPDAKLYAELPIVDWSEQRKGARPIPPTDMTGADVTITTDSVDTGERRHLGTYTARHVRITINVDAGPGAAMPSSVEERDGWYIDLPGLGCRDSGKNVGSVYASLRPAQRQHDRIHFKRLGTAPAGFPVEETIKRTEQGDITVSKVELVEFSEAPIDDALFKVPAGYHPALPTPRGGFDMMKPDTLVNRVQVYWAELQSWTSQWFR